VRFDCTQGCFGTVQSYFGSSPADCNLLRMNCQCASFVVSSHEHCVGAGEHFAKEQVLGNGLILFQAILKLFEKAMVGRLVVHKIQFSKDAFEAGALELGVLLAAPAAADDGDCDNLMERSCAWGGAAASMPALVGCVSLGFGCSLYVYFFAAGEIRSLFVRAGTYSLGPNDFCCAPDFFGNQPVAREKTLCCGAYVSSTAGRTSLLMPSQTRTCGVILMR
jgi:hypothetical protein